MTLADRAGTARPAGDLQAKLAARLRQVDAGEHAVSAWMAVEIGPRALLAPLSHAAEILPWQRLQPVPHTRPWFLGLASWRGELSGVIDLAAFLGGAAAPRSEQALAQCRLLTLNPALEVNAALLIDRVGGLKSPGDFRRAHEPDQPSQSRWPFLGNLFIDHSGQTWQELNLQTLTQQPEFLSIRT